MNLTLRMAALLAGLAPALAAAATLYEWTGPDGETHYGYRPPPGVVGSVVAGKRRLDESGQKTDCRALQEEHLRLVDKEIARLKSLPTGVGPEFEFTAEAKQRFINDLLAHRAALLTGRAPEDFAPPDNKRQLTDLNAKYVKDKEQLTEELAAQRREVQQQRNELERQRRENQIILQRDRYFYRGWLF